MSLLMFGLDWHEMAWGCLSFQGNDHRFTAHFNDELGLKSRSRSFDKELESSWVSSLEHVHDYAWKRWNSYSKEFPSDLHQLQSINFMCWSLIDWH